MPSRVFIVLLILAGTPSRSVAASDSLGTIEGQVVVDPRMEPVPFANVDLPGTPCATRADAEGRFTLAGVPPGRHVVHVFSPALFAYPRTLDVAPGRNPSAVLVMGRVRNVETGAVFIPGPRRVLARGDLVAEITPVRAKIKVFETPSFRVRIRNRSQGPILLVYCNSWSSWWSSPRATIEIAAPFDAFTGGWGQGAAYVANGRHDVWPEDFVELAPGESFAPYGEELVTPNYEGKSATRPGLYGVTFRYSTSNSDVGSWTTWYPNPHLLALLAQVPSVELEAKAEFKVDY